MKDAEHVQKMIRIKNLFRTGALASFTAALFVAFLFVIKTSSEAEVVNLISNIIGCAIFMLIAHVGLNVIIMSAKKQAEKEEESDT